ncbi:MAG: hypothetical protein KA138_12150 [Saprospiraceae bacterium]|jgi:hypothetical protein|nr:hypothetical protein [Saprospiraceae bacterium]
MKPVLFYTAAIALLALVHSACNPDCNSLVNVQSSTSLNPAGYEILITANPLSDLKGRKVFFGDVEARSVFHEGFGLVVEVPEGVSGNLEIKMEDPDCLDVQTIPFNVVDANFLLENMDYVPPTPPDIIIPVVPISFPSNVDNAWLSPDNPEYCLWFTMYKEFEYLIDTATNKPALDANGLPIKIVTGETTLVDPHNSFEQATCGCLRDFSVSHLPYAMNRMGGIVDKTNNVIEIYIDRTPIGGDIEHFSGKFIEIEKTPYSSDLGVVTCPSNVPPCGPTNGYPKTSRHMMLLTSQTTGRQVVAFQLTGF